MEGLPRHTRSSFKRSTMNYRSPSQTPSASQRVGMAKSDSKFIPRKGFKGFLYSLVGKRFKKVRSPNREEGYQIPLRELDVRKLIRLYSKHENLYNPKHYYYGNKEFAEDCYNDMARSIPGKSGFELRSCIEELRYLFEREYEVIESARVNKGKVPVPSIRYYNEFRFLVPYLSMDFEKPHAESGTSSQNPKYVTKPASALQSNNRNNFTGFPLAAFPGTMCCSPKEILKRTLKKDVKKQTKEEGTQISDAEKKQQDVTFTPSVEQRLNDIVAGKRVSKESLTSSHYADEKDLKTTDLTCPLRSENSPCASECRLPHTECPFSESKSPTTSKPQESMKPAGESVHPVVLHTCLKSNCKNNLVLSQKQNSDPTEQEKYSRRSDNSPTDIGLIIQAKPMESFKSIATFAAWEEEQFMMAHPPQFVGKKKSIKSSYQAEHCPCSLPEERKKAAPEDKRANPSVAKYQNFKQVQMLCEMIRTELTAAPDFIYFDAKWRIIEILREVHKRQLVHMKARPHKNADKLNQLKIQIAPNKPNKNSTSPPRKPALSKISDHIRGSHCPYCCHLN